MTQRAGDPAGSVFGIPRPVPRADALLQVGDDLAADAAVNVTDFGHGVLPRHGVQLLLHPATWRTRGSKAQEENEGRGINGGTCHSVASDMAAAVYAAKDARPAVLYLYAHLFGG
jgi:hypothetical protein